jgi:hypothetical protein
MAWQGQCVDLCLEDGFVEDGRDDFCSVCIRCTLRVSSTGTPVLDDVPTLKVRAHGSDNDHPFIKLVGVSILIAKKVA